ncbi:MAG: hypothetical protein RL754_42 [Bacteroidota bacterium]|jgi:redox-sensitive bicupin YhaK (pirin superfamily)
MKTIIHPADQRGAANHGWLNAKHSFSFANYFDRNKMHFGVLRVLNDDIIAPAMGFGTHPHDNMEIITIPLKGALKHKDSMGHEEVITAGEIQVMSAGTGIQHSEFNAKSDEEINLLQIWLFPKVRNVRPRYQQIALPDLQSEGILHQVLSPKEEDEGVWIHQDAWFHMGTFAQGQGVRYAMKGENTGVYAFVIEGDFEVAGQVLGKRDALGVWESEEVELVANSNSSRILLMEVPMALPRI